MATKRKSRARRKPKVLDWRVVGINVRPGGGRGFPSAHVLYKVTYIDGNEITSKVVRGASLRTTPGFEDMNGTKAQKAKAGITLHPAIEDHIRAAGLLLSTLERVCVDMDTKLGLPQLDWTV